MFNRNAVSAVLICKGTKASNGNHVDVALMLLAMHVFTWLRLRAATPLGHDRQNQTNAFTDIATTIIKPFTTNSF